MRYVIVSLVLSLIGQVAWGQCMPTSVELRGDWGTARFHVEIADTAETRAEGLMHREALAMGSGMLFIYDQPRRVAFWMRNTLIPLDMIFVGADGGVRKVHDNAVPLDETPIPGGEDIAFVLEINGGLAKRIGISQGSEMRHEAVDQDLALWPCQAN